MQASADSLAFAPPAEPGAIRAFVLAVVAHLLLLIALAWGINWQKESMVAAEAELWARMPEQAAPAPAPAPPVPQPTPAPPPVVEKTTPPPVAKEPDIVQERERKRREEEAQRQREQEERKALEAKKKQQQEEAAKREQAAKEKAAEERLKQEQLAKEKAAEERRKQEQLAKAAEKERQDQEKRRKENIARSQALAGSTGAPSAIGSALRSKGPSASYAGRIAGRIKPNIVFTDVVGGNPPAVVQLRVAPDGTIVGSRLVKSSGLKAWDDAVLRAIDKTATIPRDTDGSVVPEFEIEFRPKD